MNTGLARLPLAKSSLIAIMVLVISTVLVNRLVAARLAWPEKLSRLNLFVSLTDKQIEKLRAGQPVSKLLSTSVDYEVAVFGAAWINAPASEYVESVQNIEEFEKGENFLVTKRLSDPPQLEDFAAVDLTDQDVDDLKMCRVGACKLKMGRDAIARLGRENHSAKTVPLPDATTLFRQVLFDYTIAYQHGGNAQLPVYQDKHHSTSVANEFSAMIDETPALLRHAPSLRQYLLEYPNDQLSDGTSFFYWQEVDFGLKPTFRINHVAISWAADNIVIASKLLYASHYFRAALELQMLVPDSSRGSGFWLVTVKRLRSDGLSGSSGDMIRTRIQNEALKGLTKTLTATKYKLEQGEQPTDR
jgi:hypothetical protein